MATKLCTYCQTANHRQGDLCTFDCAKEALASVVFDHAHADFKAQTPYDVVQVHAAGVAFASEYWPDGTDGERTRLALEYVMGYGYGHGMLTEAAYRRNGG